MIQSPDLAKLSTMVFIKSSILVITSCALAETLGIILLEVAMQGEMLSLRIKKNCSSIFRIFLIFRVFRNFVLKFLRSAKAIALYIHLQ